MGCENLASKADITVLNNKIDALGQRLAAIEQILRDIRGTIAFLIDFSRKIEATIIAEIGGIRALIEALRDVVLAAIYGLRDILLELIRRFFDPNGDRDFDYERIEKAINGAHAQTRNILEVKIDTLYVLLQTILAFLKAFKVEIDYKKIRSIVEAAHQDTRGFISARLEIILSKIDAALYKLDEILRKLDFSNLVMLLQTIYALLKDNKSNVDYQRIEKAINGAHVQTRTLILEAIGRAVEHLVQLLKSVKPDYNRVESIVSKHHAATRAFIAGLFNNFKLPPVNLLEVLNKLDRLESLMSAGIGSMLSLLNTIWAFLRTFRPDANVDYQRIEKAINGAHIQTRTIILQSISNGVQYLAELIQKLKLSVDYDRIKRLIDKATADVQNYIYDRSKNAIDYSRIQKIVDDSNAVNRTQLISLVSAYGGAILKAISDLKSSTFTIVSNSQGNNLIQKIYDILGGSEYPIDVPSTLIQETNNNGTPIVIPTIQIKSLTELVHWFFHRWEEATGQWEVPIKIKDTDLVEAGDQTKIMKFPNQSEMLAEMFMLLFQAQINTETLINMCTRVLFEGGQDKQQNFITYKLLYSLVDWAGYKTKDVAEEMPLLFTPNETDLSEILKETKVKVGTQVLDEKFGLEIDLMRFRKAAATIDAVHFRKINPFADIAPQIMAYLLGAKNTSDKLNDDAIEDDFDQFVDETETGFQNTPGITNPELPYGKPFAERPKIRDLTESSQLND